ncbi:MAG TPA: hypothetical protein VJ724_10615, partial [Tahibacter sp.]|nr:hypothetical protein [Tahibacter sp.]
MRARNSIALAALWAMTMADHSLAGTEPGTRLFGPYFCSLCAAHGNLGSDPQGALLDLLRAVVERTPNMTPGDQVKVHNKSQYVTYTWT